MGRQFSRLLAAEVCGISGSNAGYTMFRGSVKSTGYWLHSPISPSLHLPCVTVYHHISTGLYIQQNAHPTNAVRSLTNPARQMTVAFTQTAMASYIIPKLSQLRPKSVKRWGADKSLARPRKETSYSDQTPYLFNIPPPPSPKTLKTFLSLLL